MSDEPDEPIVDAIQSWYEACESQVDAEIVNEQEQSEESQAALEAASDEVDAAQDFVLDLIRQEKEAENPTPYRGPFRE